MLELKLSISKFWHKVGQVVPDKIEKRYAQHALRPTTIVAVLNVHFADSYRHPTKQIRSVCAPSLNNFRYEKEAHKVESHTLEAHAI